MSTKTYFKRISLAVVVALGMGVVATAPSNALPINTSLTLSASTATVNIGETASVTIDAQVTALVQNETLTAQVTPSGGGVGEATSYLLVPVVTDSVNVSAHQTTIEASAQQVAPHIRTTLAVVSDSSVVGVSSAGSYSRAKWTFKFYKATVAGTRVFNISLLDAAGTVVGTPATFTVTVAAPDTDSTALYSKIFVNKVVDNPSTAITEGRFESDSALVVSAGTAATPVAQGYIHAVVRNASDTKTTSGGAVTGNVTLVVSGPGLLSTNDWTSAKAKQITIASTDTATIWSDGTPGTMTITAYNSTTLTAANKYAQAAKTVTFFGPATTFTVTAESATVVRGDTANGFVTFTAKDAAGNAVTSAALQTNGYTNFYAISSDTNVLNSAVVRTVGNKYVTCDYNSARAKFVCNMGAVDSGTATITISDSPTASSIVSAATTITVIGTPYTGTISVAKASAPSTPATSFTVGEKVIFTATAKDGIGTLVGTRNSTSQWSTLGWSGTAPVFVNATGPDAAGGTATSGELTTGWMTSASNTFVDGVDTLVVYMPNTAGTYTLTGRTSGATASSTLLSFTITDPVQDAQTAAIAAAQKAAVAQAAAAQAAADAATDAALQAIDAANAATDAANLAAEAADAATVAAQEAKDAADAATAAVESLATQVATLMAALQAQITSLANVVAKIAKKVKA